MKVIYSWQVLNSEENKKGNCLWCTGPITDKRRTRYCSRECSKNYLTHFNWIDASGNALQRANGRCEKCGYRPTSICKYDGKEYSDRSKLNVHHIIPIRNKYRIWSRYNIPCNLIVLCIACHKAEHAKISKGD